MFHFKTSRIGRFINSNIGRIILVIGIILFAFIVTQVLNQAAKDVRKQESLLNITTQQDSQMAYITGTTVNEETFENHGNIISRFIDYCNEGRADMAYELLSDDCKNAIYPTLEQFDTNYCKRNFATSKGYNIEVAGEDKEAYTYKVDISDDVMSTGIKNEANTVSEYMTIVNEDGAERLNISNYIEKVNINKSNEQKSIKITVESKEIYMDYEIYNFTVENNSDNIIALDSKESVQSTFLVSNTGTAYSSYVYEMIPEELQVDSKETKEISIKFNKIYNPNIIISEVTFNDIVANYTEYLNRNNFNKIQMTIQL